MIPIIAVMSPPEPSPAARDLVYKLARLIRDELPSHPRLQAADVHAALRIALKDLPAELGSPRGDHMHLWIAGAILGGSLIPIAGYAVLMQKFSTSTEMILLGLIMLVPNSCFLLWHLFRR